MTKTKTSPPSKVAHIAIIWAFLWSYATSLGNSPPSPTPRRPSSSSSLSSTTTTTTHTLILCRHGDSIWNGGHPGHFETFTGWTDVPLSPRGYTEAKNTATQLSSTYNFGIDACFTSILSRARLTAHECVWAYGDMPSSVQVGKYISDYRLNERHYGALQGYVKADVENGLYGHCAKEVEGWRRSWYAVPPLLEEEDERRMEEVRKFGNYCGGADNVPRGESLEMVAKDRIKPFLDEVLCPTLNEAVYKRTTLVKSSDEVDEMEQEGGTGLVVAHANSLRALIGVICNVEQDEVALEKLERMKIQTGIPLVMRYKQQIVLDEDGCVVEMTYKACDLLQEEKEVNEASSISSPTPDLPVWPLASIPWSGKRVKRKLSSKRMETTSASFYSSDGEQTFIFDICPRR